LPLFTDNHLSRAEIIGTEVPARNIEGDDEYRQRIIDRINRKAFGGNIADYRRLVKEIPEVGALKVFPVWDGGGTVKISVVDSEYNCISDEFRAIIKNTVDPAWGSGQGIGTAPIGHTVTVDTPQAFMVNISAIVTANSVTVGQILPLAMEKINAYFLELREKWANETGATNIYNIMIASAILHAHSEILNVTDVLLNGQVGDVTLDQTAELQLLPYLGTVALNGH
jgi:uncharacterized phage protein gp47/JayE